MAGVSIEHVTKVYKAGTPPASDDISVEIRDGEFFILLGPSGCGKSTLLRMIAGLERTSSGTIRIGDRVVDGGGTYLEPKNRDIAMVFQSYALYPHMTVAENMGFGLRMRGVDKATIKAKTEEAARKLDLDTLLERLPKELSGGQRQRVALGRALVREPSVFLLDEPLSNLDAKLRGTMRVTLKQLQVSLATTMIYVTHDQVEAMTLGDRVAVFNAGRLQQVGPPLEIYHRPVNRFVAGFLGAPPMNFFRAEGLTGGLVELDGAQRYTLPERLRSIAPEGFDGELGVRPEDLIVEPANRGQIQAGVEVVEPLGDHTDVHVRLVGVKDGPMIVARAPEGSIPAREEIIALVPRPDHVHLFARDSGENIGLETAEAAS